MGILLHYLSTVPGLDCRQVEEYSVRGPLTKSPTELSMLSNHAPQHLPVEGTSNNFSIHTIDGNASTSTLQKSAEAPQRKRPGPKPKYKEPKKPTVFHTTHSHDFKKKFILYHNNAKVPHWDSTMQRDVLGRPYYREVYEHFRPARGIYAVSFSTMCGWLKNGDKILATVSTACLLLQYSANNLKQKPTSKAAEPPKPERVKGEPRPPTPLLTKYSTNFYKAYDHNNPNPGVNFPGAFAKFADYDGYVLYTNPHLTDVTTVPKAGVRLDDLTISRLIGKFSGKQLTQLWPAEFEKNGMVRSTRVPLGNAAKVWVNIGEKDLQGNEVKAGQEGYYYKWYAGVHQLCGKEGLDNGKFMIRAFAVKFETKGFGFKIGHRAVYQCPETTMIDGAQGRTGAEEVTE